jgi:hypothetical protein
MALKNGETNRVHKNAQLATNGPSSMPAGIIGKRPKRDASNRLKETTDLILADLERDSKFFNENPPMLLPEFDPAGEFQVGNSVFLVYFVHHTHHVPGTLASSSSPPRRANTNCKLCSQKLRWARCSAKANSVSFSKF